MANDWFQFKQFKIEQGKCGMKVSTDACIFGALIANEFAALAQECDKALDIGTGTGLLSLMLVQACPNLSIDAVELDEQAYEQAVGNFKASKWANNLHPYLASIQHFKERYPLHTYQFIFSNPPFFFNQLQAPTAQRNQARHEVTLTKNELLDIMYQYLSENGIAALLYPASVMDEVLQLAKNIGFEVLNVVKVYPNENKSYNRFVVFLRKRKKELSIVNLDITYTELFIRKENSYTYVFQKLMQDYYL